jgi:ATP-dependent helicase/nuclease subunit A
LLSTLQEEDVRVSVYGQEDLLAGDMSEQLQMAARKMALEKGTEADANWMEQLESIFAYRYPHDNLQSLYTKTTVSELKIAAMADKDEAAYHAFEEPEPEPILPTFMREQEQQVSGATRGNAYHKAMELMDFEKVYDEQGEPVWDKVEALLEAYVTDGRLEPEYKEILSKHKLMNFLKDPLAKRMKEAQQAGQLYKEQPFVLGIPANRLNPEFPSEEKVLIQGIIDAFFIEDGAIVLLDYKTDRVNTAKELWDRYETQLDYYEEALSKLMKMPVKERILYSFSLESCVK